MPDINAEHGHRNECARGDKPCGQEEVDRESEGHEGEDRDAICPEEIELRLRRHCLR